MNAGFDSLGCAFENGGDFGLGQFLVGSEEQGLAQIIGEGGAREKEKN